MLQFITRQLKLFYLLAVLGCSLVVVQNVSAKGPVRLLVPGTPSAIPLLLAGQKSDDVDVEIVQSRAQAHARFIRGDAELLLTGLSVGMKMFEQGVPVKMLASHVASLSYLVVNKELAGDVQTFTDLKGQTVSFPFSGSPLEEVSRYFAVQEGLDFINDIQPSYNSLQVAVMKLKQGKVAAAPMPEPFVSLALKGNDELAVSIDYNEQWHKYNSADYPQVVLLAKTEWYDENRLWFEDFAELLEEAIGVCENDPVKAIEKTAESFALSEDVLRRSLAHTRFHLNAGSELKNAVFTYYKEIGKDLEKQSFVYDQLF